MKLGDKGPEVKELQEKLIALGYDLKADGDFGPKTLAAVKAFQKQHDLEDDGVVGKLTLKKIQEHTAPKPEPKPEPKSEPKPEPKPEPVDGVFDARTAKNLATLDAKAVPAFTAFITEAKKVAAKLGYEYVAISGNRTWEEQDALYAQGRSKPGQIVTKAKGGQSNHNFKIALDFGVFKNGNYIDDDHPVESEKVHRAVAKVAPKYGIEWGGLWQTIKDYPHFEIGTGLSMTRKRELFAKNGSVL